ncbi:MAG: outer membrane beta-barrel protein [Saprospiraceae bacterium]
MRKEDFDKAVKNKLLSIKESAISADEVQNILNVINQIPTTVRWYQTMSFKVFSLGFIAVILIGGYFLLQKSGHFTKPDLLSDVKVKSEIVTQPIHPKKQDQSLHLSESQNVPSKLEILPSNNDINHLEKSNKIATPTVKTTLQSTIRDNIGSTHNYFNENEKNNEVFASRNVLKTGINTQEPTQQIEQTNPLNLHHSESNSGNIKGVQNTSDASEGIASIENPEHKGENGQQDTQVQEDTKILVSAITSLSAKPLMLHIPQRGFDLLTKQITPSSKNQKWAIGITGALGDRPNYVAGLFAEYHLNERWTVISGIDYVMIGGRSYYNPVAYIYRTGLDFYNTYRVNSIPDLYNIRIKENYISVPLTARYYQPIWRGYSAFAGVGIRYQLLNIQEVSYTLSSSGAGDAIEKTYIRSADQAQHRLLAPSAELGFSASFGRYKFQASGLIRTEPDGENKLHPGHEPKPEMRVYFSRKF